MVKNPPAKQEGRFDPWVRKIPWSRRWPPTPVFMTGKPHGERSVVGYSPQGCKDSDMTEHVRRQRFLTMTLTSYRKKMYIQEFKTLKTQLVT